MKDLNILIFPAGTEIGLEINKSLSYCKDITMFGASSVISNHAPYVFKNYIILPSITDIDFIDKLNAFVTEHNIDYIYPAHDDVILFLSDNRDKICTKIICPSKETCNITRYKSKTYKKLSGVIDIPKIYDSIGDCEYPIFVKPDKGEGSRGAKIIYNKKELEMELNNDNSILFLELLTGDEYTVDCFSDRDKGLLYARARQRIRTRNGISMNSANVYEKDFFDIAAKICGSIELYGAWFFQVKYSRDNKLKLLEVAPRIPGTMCVSRADGINLPLLSIYEQERKDIRILSNNIQIEVDRALHNKYSAKIDYHCVYVDYDDTLIIKNVINAQLVSFLYQCINNNKKIVLLTRHDKSTIKDELEKRRLYHIFDEIYVLENSDKKSQFINDKDSIFIDDSYREREDVASIGVKTFDCSQIEVLIDHRN